MSEKVLLDSKKIQIILLRLVYEIIENHQDLKDTILIGLQPRGVFLYEQILKYKKIIEKSITSGVLDFTFLEMILGVQKKL